MNVIALGFLIASVTSVIMLPRKWAPIPLLASCCYMTIGQGVDVGPLSLPVFRLVLAAGLVRVIVRREYIVGGINTIDKLIIVWAMWMIFAGFFHEWKPGSGPVYASGFVFNIVLVYFLTRVWCDDLTNLMAVFRTVAWLLVPVAGAMLAEHLVQKNYFGMLFGGVSEGVYWREGRIRAQGPFVHPILAGTVGAVCFPLMLGIWRRYRLSAAVGMAACLAIVLASTSSGPLMSLFVGVLGVLMWSYQRWLRTVRWALVGAYLCAELLMTRPAYYLISKIDLTGSSTGWHRSRLIEAAFEHLPEWWMFGTDYTVHWMGIAVDEAGQTVGHHELLLWIGTIGGLPAMLLLIAMIWCAFAVGGKDRQESPRDPSESPFHDLVSGRWASLPTRCTSLSMGYTDQSMMFFWLNIGAISSMYSVARIAAAAEQSVSSSVAPDPGPKTGRAGRGAHSASASAGRAQPHAIALRHQGDPQEHEAATMRIVKLVVSLAVAGIDLLQVRDQTASGTRMQAPNVWCSTITPSLPARGAGLRCRWTS